MSESIEPVPSSTGFSSTETSSAETGGRPSVVFGVVALDTDEPRRLAEFYAALLGWRVHPSDEDDWVQIGPSADAEVGEAGGGGAEAGAELAFQLVPDYKAPTWPTQAVPQQLHLDFDVTDLDVGERFALSLGASRVPDSGVEDSFRVFLDPSGHPFCLCKAG